MLGEKVLKEDPDGVPEDDRIGDLHHRGFHVKREEHSSLLRLGHLLLKKRDERFLVHHSGVKNLACFERGFLLEDGDVAVCRDELDSCICRLGHGDRLLIREEVVLAHRNDIGLRSRRTRHPSNADYFSRIP